MDVARGARREWAFVVLVAVAGIALASLVAFAPWYEPATLPKAVPAGHLESVRNLTEMLAAMIGR
jgi:hypothetical protein